MRVREALAAAAHQLETVQGVPRLDAELLMAAALGTSHGEMMLSRLDDPAPPAFETLVRRRLTEEPMGYVIGNVGFWTIELEIGPGVLIPRADSETLIEAALGHFGAGGPSSILDLGTGPGTLLLAALAQWPAAGGLGVDASEEALAYARRNAGRLGLADRAEFRVGDWGHGLRGRFDLVLCNPPYVQEKAALIAGVADWEPGIALFGGADGLEAYRALAPHIAALLAPGGIACLEIGAGHEKAVRALFGAAGFTIESRSDFRGIVRCLILRLNRE